MRLLMRQRPFLDRPGTCRVCATELLASSKKELSDSGWTVQRAAALCPSCKSEGWELSPRSIPYRVRKSEGIPEPTGRPTEGGTGRLRLRRRPFLDRPGRCRVCATELLVDSKAELTDSGWTVQRDAALCQVCTADGWDLTQASVPYRVRAVAVVDEADASPPPREARKTASRISPRMAVATFAALVAAAAGGLLAGASRTESDVEGALASSGPIGVSVPGEWERRDVGASLPGLSPSLELAPRDQAQGGLVAGEIRSAERLIEASERPVHPELVLLGETVALEYRGLSRGESDSPLALYIVPTGGRDIAVACVAGGIVTTGFLDRCAGVASSLVLRDGEGLSADAVRESAASLTRTMAELRSMRARGRASLSNARTATGQAKASQRLARAYSAAATTLLAPPAAPASEQLYADVIAGLREAKAAYTALGSAARDNQSSGFYAARADIRRAEAALRGALRQTQRTFGADG